MRFLEIKKKTLFVFFSFVCAILFGQNNLIHNADFEDAESGEPNAPCKTGLADLSSVWEADDFFGGICTYKTCNGDPNCNCSANCKWHTPDWYDNSDSYCHFVERQPNGNVVNVQARSGSRFIGMRPKEIIEQNFFNSSPIVGGRTYVFSAYVRIPRPLDPNAPIGYYNNYQKRAYGCTSGTGGGDSHVNEDFTENDKISLNVLLSTQKIKYSDALILTCNSTESGNTKDVTNNHIIKANENTPLIIDISNYPLYEWHRISFEFTCPTSHQYDWVGLELDDQETDNHGYLFIDDVSILDKCELGCTKTSGTPNPLISSYDPEGANLCAGGMVSNIGNVRKIKLEVFDAQSQLIRTIEKENTNGFNDPVFWEGLTDAPTSAAAGLYVIRATCTNDCGTFIFSHQVSNPGCFDIPNPPLQPNSVITDIKYNDCCEIDFNFNNKTFSSFTPYDHPYWYRPKHNIYINSCQFTTISNSTFKAGNEIQITGETIISPGNTIYQTYYPEFHASIEECPDAHRYISTHVSNLSEIEFSQTSQNPKKAVQENQETIEIIPNPNNGSFVIDFKKNSGSINSIEIHNSFGKTIMKVSAPYDPQTEVDIQDQAAGLYLVKIIYANKVIVKKVIKQ